MICFVQALIDGVMVGLVYGLDRHIVRRHLSRLADRQSGAGRGAGDRRAVRVDVHARAPTLFGYEMPLLSSVSCYTGAACVLLGLLLERLVFRPLIGQPAFAIFMASIALLVMLRGVAQMIWTAADPAFPRDSAVRRASMRAFLLNTRSADRRRIHDRGGVRRCMLFFTRTRQGLRLAAVAESHNTALSLGVSVRSAIAIAWILGTVVATCGAIVLLSGRIMSLDVAEIGFKALPVALLGGLESVRGAPLAGVSSGIGERLAMTYLDPVTNGVGVQVLPFARHDRGTADPSAGPFRLEEDREAMTPCFRPAFISRHMAGSGGCSGRRALASVVAIAGLRACRLLPLVSDDTARRRHADVHHADRRATGCT